ncbi:hypothetical protein ABH917_003708 [Thermobifida halotolerans]
MSSVNLALPQTRRAREPSTRNSTGCGGRLRTISASSRPDTRTLPGSSTWTSTDARAETS